MTDKERAEEYRKSLKQRLMKITLNDLKCLTKIKKQNKPSRSKRRYQAYLDWNDGIFKDFLDWLKITDKDELYYSKEFEVIRDYKKKWQI